VVDPPGADVQVRKGSGLRFSRSEKGQGQKRGQASESEGSGLRVRRVRPPSPKGQVRRVRRVRPPVFCPGAHSRSSWRIAWSTRLAPTWDKNSRCSNPRVTRRSEIRKGSGLRFSSHGQKRVRPPVFGQSVRRITVRPESRVRRVRPPVFYPGAHSRSSWRIAWSTRLGPTWDKNSRCSNPRATRRSGLESCFEYTRPAHTSTLRPGRPRNDRRVYRAAIAALAMLWSGRSRASSASQLLMSEDT
jgi:hypothetical protein